MVKLQVLFRTGQRSEAYYESYNRFLMKIDELPGLRRKSVSSVYGAMGGAIPFDTIVTEAMVNGKAVVEYNEYGHVSEEIRHIWRQVDSSAKRI